MTGRAALCLALVAACAPGRGSAPAAPAVGAASGAEARRDAARGTAGTRESSHAVAPILDLTRPPGFEILRVADDDDGADDLLPLHPETPDRPRSMPLVRPRSGGEALALADLALTRGDAFDAIAQYRALLPQLEPDAVPYAELQLARALAARGEREEARAGLSRLATRDGPVAWAALVDLANLRIHQVGAVEATRELEHLSNARHEALVDELIHQLSREHSAALLLDKARRLERCGYAFEAVQRWPDVETAAVPARCRGRVANLRWMVERRERSRSYLAVQRRINPLVERWDALAVATRNGDHDPAPWVALAEDTLVLRELAEEAGRRGVIDRTARAALVIAIELALARASPDERLLPQIYAASDRVEREHRGAVRAHVDLLRRGRPRR
mgnify:CR=1 FL=1